MVEVLCVLMLTSCLDSGEPAAAAEREPPVSARSVDLAEAPVGGPERALPADPPPSAAGDGAPQ